jgi:hypothetical protein
MRVAALLPLALVPLASASLATDAYKWASDLVSSDNVQASKNGEVHTMDSWSYVDCGESLSVIPCLVATCVDGYRTPNRCRVSCHPHPSARHS